MGVKRGAPLSRRSILKTASTAAGGAALMTLAPALARAQRKSVKIGLVTPEHRSARLLRRGGRLCRAAIPPVVASGVKIAGATYPVELIVKDSQSNPNRAAEVAGELILNDKVDLMVAAHTPETTNPVCDQCEINGVPCISTDAPWQSWFFGRRGDPAKGFNGPTISSSASRA